MARKRGGPKARRDEPTSEVAVALAAALAPHVDVLAAAAAEREAEALARVEAGRVRRLDEAELMTLIFEHLDDDNPRVCAGIDFDRLVVLDTSLVRAALGQPGDPSREPDPPLAIDVVAPRAVPSAQARLVEHAWVGRNWLDEVQAIDPAMLDRPELDADARALLERARGRLLPTLNLRRLERSPALAHLDMFVHACRQQRARYARVITGKGIESRVEPVIKRAVLGWCLDARLVTAPELDVHGEWGALIVDLRPA